MKSCLKLLFGVTALVSLSTAAAAAPILFDIDGEASGGNNGPTQAGWTSLTNGSTATNPDGVMLTITGDSSIAGDGRNRLTAATPLGEDNDDNPVPEGMFAPLYQDFIFARGANVMTASFAGLAADTTYTATVWSYDSGAFLASGDAVLQDFTVGGSVVANLSYSGDLAGGLGPDPDTSTLVDYAVTFLLTSDATGAASFSTVSTGSQGARLNGVRLVEIPEPAALGICLLAVAGMTGVRRQAA